MKTHTARQNISYDIISLEKVNYKGFDGTNDENNLHVDEKNNKTWKTWGIFENV